MWQGDADTLVASTINTTIADRMPGAIWHPVEGGGHFVAIGAGDEILGGEALRRRVGGRRAEAPPPDDLAVVVVHRPLHLLQVGPAKALGPVVTAGAVVPADEAADVAQSPGIDVGRGRQRPRLSLGPAGDAELLLSERVVGSIARCSGRSIPTKRTCAWSPCRRTGGSSVAEVVEHEPSLRVADVQVGEAATVVGRDRGRVRGAVRASPVDGCRRYLCRTAEDGGRLRTFARRPGCRTFDVDEELPEEGPGVAQVAEAEHDAGERVGPCERGAHLR
jgi:hypothetical protein